MSKEAPETSDKPFAEQSPDEFKKLMTDVIKPRDDKTRERVEQAVATLAEQALADVDLISDYALDTIEKLRRALDRKLSDQVNLILHHAAFQKLEGTWRGLHHLVNNVETDKDLKIKIFNISKGELGKTLKKFKGVRWDQSPIFQKVYEQGFGILGGEPFACLVGDYYFDHSPQDVQMLEEMAGTAAAAHAPFIAGASPTVLNMESWQQLPDPWQLAKTFSDASYAGWTSLRESQDASYIGLTLPRFLARLPYGAKTQPVEGFEFEEETGNGDHSKYAWSNSAFAMAVNIADAFKRYGWCTAIRGVQGGGEFSGLLCHTFPTDDGGTDMKCPTEIAITDRREKELADCGFIPLLHRVNTDRAAFIGAQSLNRPLKYATPDEQAAANLTARLPYLFACCRFAHYLKAICRDMVGKFTSRADMEKFLNDWVSRYVEINPEGKKQSELAKKPLAAALVTVKDVEGNPGYYEATIQLRPHYQLEGIKVDLSLVSRLKAE